MTLKEVIAKIEKVLFHPLGVQKSEVEALMEEIDMDLPHDATELTAIRDKLVKELPNAIDKSSTETNDAGGST